MRAFVRSLTSFLLCLFYVSFISQVDGSFFVGLVNKDGEDAASKVGTTYSHPEREFLKDLIKTLATGTHPERGGSMTSSDALNMGLMDFGNDEVPAYWKKLSKKEREMALRKFIEDGYLECPQQGVFSLGVRTLLELNNFIMQMDLPPDNREAFEKFL
ncbi:unnamed protein product [Ostreobium quekettii]|uniref:Non-structural maintenance of chromosomes element 1 homolog n=1 Tax=Ostreobium quekettii TaxID=121088 RepID=A0A8S1INC0_9CHLO|nr:unnamed protein product [Ostreobium quekettii]